MKAFLGHVIWKIYVSPLWLIRVAMAALVVIWGLLGLLGTRKFPKLWRGVNIFCCVCSVLGILYVTLFKRSPHEQFLQLIPFHFIVEAKEHIEILRSMLMNVFLFVPLGLSLPFSVNGKLPRTVIFTLVSALIFSVCIEVVQYHFGLGRAETDDVLCNVFGTLIGCLAFCKTLLLKKVSENANKNCS